MWWKNFLHGRIKAEAFFLFFTVLDIQCSFYLWNDNQFRNWNIHYAIEFIRCYVLFLLFLNNKLYSIKVFKMLFTGWFLVTFVIFLNSQITNEWTSSLTDHTYKTTFFGNCFVNCDCTLSIWDNKDRSS